MLYHFSLFIRKAPNAFILQNAIGTRSRTKGSCELHFIVSIYHALNLYLFGEFVFAFGLCSCCKSSKWNAAIVPVCNNAWFTFSTVSVSFESHFVRPRRNPCIISPPRVLFLKIQASFRLYFAQTR